MDRLTSMSVFVKAVDLGSFAAAAVAQNSIGADSQERFRLKVRRRLNANGHVRQLEQERDVDSDEFRCVFHVPNILRKSSALGLTSACNDMHVLSAFASAQELFTR